MTEQEQPAGRGSKFLDDFAHEIKTPLTSLIASWSLLAEELNERDDGPIPRLVRNIGRSAISMRIIIDELIDTARMHSAELVINRTEVDVSRTINDCISQLRIIAEGKGQNIEADLPDELPLVSADSRRIEQVLLALLMSAGKNSTSGSTIIIRARADNGALTFEVKYKGLPVAQPQAESKGHAGIDMGLELAKHLVELHDGSLKIEGNETEGSTIAFSFPIAGTKG